MKKLLIIFAASILGMVACNEERVENSENLTEMKIVSNQSTSRILSDELIEDIANIHNIYCEEVLGNIDITNYNIESQINSLHSDYYNPSFGASLEIWNSLNNFDKNYLKENYIMNLSYFETFENQLSTICQNINISDAFCYNNLCNDLNILKSDVLNNLLGSDLDIALVGIETLKKSASLWLPTSAGGNGIGYSKINDIFIYKDEIPNAMSVSQIIGYTALADGVSVMYLCCVIGVSALLNPTFAPAAIMATMGMQAGRASITALFGCFAHNQIYP
jgi:hypothetical protein